ncbi:hypothetical protein JKP88DRAFT_198283 [Tribonema minus]|uniref:J domain-containing protein n=1 Tax=Tribonema minus TaxID=303371 RepID=A0A836CJW3_9STRA|nr:hypothetical protein JKP88DRAFT_198283 [Tribonema minus]
MPAALQVELCRGEHSAAVVDCVHAFQESGGAAAGGATSKAQVETCKGGNSIIPAECYRAMPAWVPQAAKLSLCKAAASAAPAQCAAALARRVSPGVAADAVARLCRGAQTEAPAACFVHGVSGVVGRTLGKADTADLCRGADSEEPVKCFAAITDRTITAESKVALCCGAGGAARAQCVRAATHRLAPPQKLALCAAARGDAPTAPLACFTAAPATLPDDLRIRLCSGAASNAPADCAKAAPAALPPQHRAELCRGAASAAPGLCARAMPIQAAPSVTVDVCRDAASAAPAQCFAACDGAVPAALAVALCRGAASTAPAECAAAAVPRSREAASNAQCPLKGASGQPRRIVPMALAVELCRASGNDAAAVGCAATAPHGFSDADLLRLCSGGGGGADGAGAVRCAAAAPRRLPAAARAELCRGAAGVQPAACADAMHYSRGVKEVVATCRGALTTTPAYCVNALHHAPGGGATARQIEDCRGAAPVHTSIGVRELKHAGEGGVLYTGARVEAVLEVKDQWGRFMEWDSGTYVRASLAPRGSNGAFIGGAGRVNATVDGVVRFSHLTFSAPGNLTLRFDVGGAHLASALLRVVETKEAAFARACGAVVRALRCPSDAAAARRAAAAELNAADEIFALVPPPLSWNAIVCGGALRNQGFRVAPGWRRAAWVWYTPAVEALATGRGVPTPLMTALERLGLGEGASGGDVRRAYYRESLRWHPDRWARHPALAERAQAVFELVSEAYAELRAGAKLAATGQESAAV